MRNLTFCLLFFLMLNSLLSKKIDITNQNPATWTIEKSSEIVLEDVFNKPFDYSYIDDKLHLVTTKPPAIAIYNLEGELENLNDSQGEGPGELGKPVYLWKSKDNGIGIYDEGHYRYHYFDSELNFLHSEDITPQTFVSKKYFSKEGNYSYITYLDVINKDFIFKHKVQYTENEETSDIYEMECHMFLKGWYRYNQPVICESNDGSIFIGIQSRTSYKLLKYDKSDKILEITKSVKPVKYSNEVIEENKEFAKTMEKRFHDMFETPKELYSNQLIISDITIDDQNRVWVLTRDVNGQFFDILSSEGEKISSVRIPESEEISRPFVKNNILYSCVSNDDEVSLISYQIKQ